jgi:hypothetical protein
LLRTVVLAARRALGLPATLRTEDRRILEQVILPEYARRPDIARVLFVGCASYTQRYGETFGGCEYWTIDPVARRRRYGSERHIVDRLQNLGIMCRRAGCRMQWRARLGPKCAGGRRHSVVCPTHLRAGGDLLLGWNDIAPRNRVLPEEIPALRRFDAALFGPSQISRWAINAPNRHVFNFYRKAV